MTPHEIAALLAENTRMRDALTALTTALAEARAEAAAHRKVAEANARQVQRLVDRLEELTGMLRRFMTARAAANLAELPTPDPEDTPPGGAPASSSGTAGPSEAPGGSGGTGRKRRPKGEGKAGRRHPKASLPPDIETPAAPTRCAHCDSPRMLARDTEVSVKFTAVTGFVRRKEIRRAVCVCADCNRRTAAPMPPMPWKNSSFTPELVAFVVYMISSSSFRWTASTRRCDVKV